MADFEVRTQRIAESEDEFMLVLVKLFRSANPAADSPTLDVAVKRKFLQGISPSLRRGIFVFCNDPYAAAVSREQLLQHCRKARVHLVPSSEEDKPETFTPPTVNALEPSSNQNPDPMVQVVQDLTSQLAKEMNVMSQRLSAQDDKINTLTNNFRGGAHPQSSRYNSSNTLPVRPKTMIQDGAQILPAAGDSPPHEKNCLVLSVADLTILPEIAFFVTDCRKTASGVSNSQECWRQFQSIGGR